MCGAVLSSKYLVASFLYNVIPYPRKSTFWITLYQIFYIINIINLLECKALSFIHSDQKKSLMIFQLELKNKIWREFEIFVEPCSES